MDNSSAVTVRGLRVVRGGREVLHGIDCEIRRGAVTGLIGPSGCGKTTLIRCVVGAQRVAGGSVTVMGRPAGTAALRGRIGYSTQLPAVYADMTAEIARVLDEVGLADYENQLVGELSGGQLSRVSLAVALLGHRELLVLDEPTVGLDPVLRRDLWQLFHRLTSGGASLLVSSHVMDEAERCDQLILMRDGAIVAIDTPAALRRRTSTENLEQAFLSLVGRREANVR
jgi:ABC-2 type transport system ATP-binding protein